MAASDASIHIGKWGVRARLSYGYILSAKGCLADVHRIGWYSAWCSMSGQVTEEFPSDPLRQEHNAATSHAKEEANSSIISDVSMTQALRT